ncbi:hypothetical protein M5689_005182 [Euphorbia peplus]|nr:hypothetical protein M5689_005182 [Euphorbia peplus]
MNTSAPEPPLAPPQQIPLPDLISSLEQATLMAKQLPATADHHHLHQIYSSLHQAHQNLSFFITQFPPPPPLNSLSSVTDEPMDIGEEAGNSSSMGTIDMVEEKFKGCFIKNKRVKRPLSPSSTAEEERRRLVEDGFDIGTSSYDPYEARLRALELVSQFHS